MFGLYLPRTWSPQSHVLASSEALGPSSHSPPRGRPFSCPHARPAPMASRPLLEVADLACRRGGRMVFDRLSFSIAAGDLLTLIGRNGAGKTTLLRALALLVRPEAGAIRWGGADVQD